jgi:hypothetical protein
MRAAQAAAWRGDVELAVQVVRLLSQRVAGATGAVEATEAEASDDTRKADRTEALLRLLADVRTATPTAKERCLTHAITVCGGGPGARSSARHAWICTWCSTQCLWTGGSRSGLPSPWQRHSRPSTRSCPPVRGPCADPIRLSRRRPRTDCAPTDVCCGTRRPCQLRPYTTSARASSLTVGTRVRLLAPPTPRQPSWPPCSRHAQ